VAGVALQGDVPKSVVNQIRADLKKYRVLIFRNQGCIEAARQVEISQWFGNLHSTFYRHPASPHPEVFRVSNERKEGCVNVGRSGWHIDGSFLSRPFSVQLMHFWSVSKGGNTNFAPLAEVVDTLRGTAVPGCAPTSWDDLYFVNREGHPHPLIYPHPDTGRDTMCFHLGDSFLGGFATRVQGEIRILPSDVSRAIRDDVVVTLESDDLMYSHEWRVGDFAIIDNLAVAHYAVPATQTDPAIAGLRILHRTTVEGHHIPRKASP